MKKISILGLSVLFFLTPSLASVKSDDPCTVFLCMSGKVQGKSPKECAIPEAKFFSIVAKKHKKFNKSRTSKAREDFLNECPGADKEFKKKIIDKFGSSKK